MAKSCTWKVLSMVFGLAAPFLSPAARSAVGLMGKFDSLRCSLLEAKDIRQIVVELSSRAGLVSAMIEHSLAERRPQDEAFNELVSTFRNTLDDVEKFYQKFWQQGWFQRLVQGDQVKSEFEGLWRRLDAHAADYRTLLLERLASRGPSERIAHPRLREFWRVSMNNVLEAKWAHLWEQLLHDFPEVQQLLRLNDNFKLLEAKADPRDPKYVGPWEINNLFQPPTSSVKHIIRTALAGGKRRLDVDTSSRASNKRIRRDEFSTTENKEVQFWIGYWVRGCHKATQTVEFLITANHRIYGGGSDEIGEFTCAGDVLGTRVHFVKHYIGRHQVEYDGAFWHTTLGGIWTKSECGKASGKVARKGSFQLKQHLQSPQSIATGRDTGIVEVGVMQHWTGHYDQGGKSPSMVDMESDIVFTHTNRIYGSGEDSVGRFTWLGRYHQRRSSTMVSICKLYAHSKHVVHYIGEVAYSFCVGQEKCKVVMDGSWMHSNNNLESGTFCLQRELNSFRPSH